MNSIKILCHGVLIFLLNNSFIDFLLTVLFLCIVQENQLIN